MKLNFEEQSEEYSWSKSRNNAIRHAFVPAIGAFIWAIIVTIYSPYSHGLYWHLGFVIIFPIVMWVGVFLICLPMDYVDWWLKNRKKVKNND